MSGSEASRRGGLPRRAISVLLGVGAAVCLAAPSWAAATITGIDVHSEPSQTVIVVSADTPGALKVTAFALRDPARLVFDLAGAELSPELPAVASVESASITQIRFGQFSVEPAIARAVVDLAEGASPPTWEVKRGKDGATLILLAGAGLPVIELPTLEQGEGALLVRVPGAGKLHRTVGEVGDPPRVYVDLEQAVVKEHCERQCDKGAVRRLRLGQQPPRDGEAVARLVLELDKAQAHSAFTEGDDLVIALGVHPWALPVGDYVGAGRLKGRTIVVDPGHGGDDIGAPAVFGRPPRGPYEKDIVLDIAHRLVALLETEGADVHMTRSDDTYVSLRDRAALANRLRADALVSIHCNSVDRANTLHGTSVYYDHAHSKRFAELVQEELIASLGTEDKGVRNANFAVIRRATGPGILVEAAYINHDGDRMKLAHPNFRERTARAVLRGLLRFCGSAPAEDGGA